jgi:hypothetical protein
MFNRAVYRATADCSYSFLPFVPRRARFINACQLPKTAFARNKKTDYIYNSTGIKQKKT